MVKVGRSGKVARTMLALGVAGAALMAGPAAATKAAAKLVRADAASLVIVGDASKCIDKLRSMRPDVEVIKADQLDLDSLLLRGTQ